MPQFNPETGVEFNIGLQDGRENQLVHQWRDIFRFGKGDRVLIFNEIEGQWLAEFLVLERKKGAELIWVEQDKVADRALPSKNTALYMSVIKNSNFDLVVEKVTELGVSRIIPVIAERTVKSGLNFERLNKLATEASEQSGRMDVPKIDEILNLKVAIDDAKARYDSAYFGHISDEELINEIPAGSIALFIGPEGGWSDAEIQLFEESDVRPIALGQFVLRAETAAIVAISRLA